MTICGTHVMALVQDLGKCSASRGVSYAILCLDCRTYDNHFLSFCHSVLAKQYWLDTKMTQHVKD